MMWRPGVDHGQKHELGGATLTREAWHHRAHYRRACTHKSARTNVGLGDVRFTLRTGHPRSAGACPLRAMCGRLRVGKKNLHVAALVGAAMCSAFECGTHDRWP